MTTVSRSDLGAVYEQGEVINQLLSILEVCHLRCYSAINLGDADPFSRFFAGFALQLRRSMLRASSVFSNHTSTLSCGSRSCTGAEVNSKQAFFAIFAF